MPKKKYSDGLVVWAKGMKLIPPEYHKPYKGTFPDFARARKEIMEGKPIPKGFAVDFNHLRYAEGCVVPYYVDLIRMKTKFADKAQEDDAVAETKEPTIDMFDVIDDSSPRTMEQNQAFWGGLDTLSKLTGKGRETMKPIIIKNALGDYKGSSKLTIAEMNRVLAYLDSTIKLFQCQVEMEGETNV